MEDRNYTGDDNREFGPPRDICTECGSDIEDDGHDVTCSYHADFFEPDDEGE